ncbi:hypothetical protein BKA63DRAFT_79988 [Paraphoma chrysanthemicola]|nr:hypothetical protein BKA63DRAFT_79988 [Paraphoma chrysanthemicola]
MSQFLTLSSPLSNKLQRFHLWKALPAELQIMVMEQYFVVRRPVTAQTHSLVYGPKLVKVAQANRSMYELAMEAYYCNNIFQIAHSKTYGGSVPRFRFPRTLIGQHIRNVELVIKMGNAFSSLTHENGLFNKWNPSYDHSQRDPGSSEVLALARPKRASDFGPLLHVANNDRTKFIDIHDYKYRMQCGIQDSEFEDLRVKDNQVYVHVWHAWGHGLSSHQGWQKGLTKLRNLTVRFEVSGCLRQRGREKFQTLPQRTKTFLRAENVQVVVDIHGCRADSPPLGRRCDGECGAIVHRTIEGMLHD